MASTTDSAPRDQQQASRLRRLPLMRPVLRVAAESARRGTVGRVIMTGGVVLVAALTLLVDVIGNDALVPAWMIAQWLPGGLQAWNAKAAR
ncbi:hypothetical protein [Nocardia sp. NPDC006630]|uniref:hypothetical protein n=1 Tax=Nocardia sp. NPDC006630 TaxID=3157181 RepID=UPI0033A176E1